MPHWTDRLGRMADRMFADMERKFGTVFEFPDEREPPVSSPFSFDKRVSYRATKGDSGVIIDIGVPGCTSNDIELDLEDAILSVTIKSGFRPGLVKQFKVNDKTDVGDIKATVKNGLLTIIVSRDDIPDLPKGKITVQ